LAGVGGFDAFERLEAFGYFGQVCAGGGYPFGGCIGDVIDADSRLPDSPVVFGSASLGDDAVGCFGDDKGLPLVGGYDLFLLFGRRGQAIPGLWVVFAGQRQREVAVHKGVDVEAFCGVDVGVPDGRVVVEVEPPEWFAGKPGGNHIRDVGCDRDAVGDFAFEDGEQSFAWRHIFYKPCTRLIKRDDFIFLTRINTD